MNHTQWPDATSMRDPFGEPPFDWDSFRSPLKRESTAIFPTQEEMLRICLDFAPAAGNDAPGRLLGPWADELDPRVPEERTILKWAVAAGCFFAPDDHNRSPHLQWASRQPLPSVDMRQAFRAIALSPWDLWEEDGGNWRSCLFGETLPVAQINKLEPSVFPFGSRRPRFWLARLVPNRTGQWAAILPLGLTAAPPPPTMASWVRSLGPAEADPRALLAARGHIFVRRVLEWYCLDVETR